VRFAPHRRSPAGSTPSSWMTRGAEAKRVVPAESLRGERKPEAWGPDHGLGAGGARGGALRHRQGVALPGAIPVFRAVATPACKVREAARVLDGGRARRRGRRGGATIGALRRTRAPGGRGRTSAMTRTPGCASTISPTASARWGTRERSADAISTFLTGRSPYYDGEIDVVAGRSRAPPSRSCSRRKGFRRRGSRSGTRPRVGAGVHEAEGRRPRRGRSARWPAASDTDRTDQRRKPGKPARRRVLRRRAERSCPPATICREGKHAGLRRLRPIGRRRSPASWGPRARSPARPRPKIWIRRPDSSTRRSGRPGWFVRWKTWSGSAPRKRYIGEWCEGLAKDKKFKDRNRPASFSGRSSKTAGGDAPEAGRRWSGARRSCPRLPRRPPLKAAPEGWGRGPARARRRSWQGLGTITQRKLLGLARLDRGGEGGEGLLSGMSKEGRSRRYWRPRPRRRINDFLQPVLEALGREPSAHNPPEAGEGGGVHAEINRVRFT